MYEEWLPESKDEISEHQRMRAKWNKLQKNSRVLKKRSRLKKILRWLFFGKSSFLCSSVVSGKRLLLYAG